MEQIPPSEIQTPQTDPINWKLCLFVFFLGLAVYLPNLGGYALWDPWEPHYSQVAMEMNQHDSWLTPHYRNGTNWFSKPILPLLLFKTSFLLFGQSDFTARLPIVLMASLGLAIMAFFMGRVFNRRVGLLSALLLMTSPQYFFIARQAIFDMPYVVLQTSALGSLILGLFVYPRESRWIYGFWVFSALAMLSKGLLAVVLPASIVGTYILATWDWSIYRRMKFGKGLLIFFIVASPWFIFMTAKFGLRYPKSFFIYHHFERMAGLIKKPNNSFELYVKQVFYALFPWSAFLPMAMARLLKFNADDLYGRNRRNFFLFLCFVIPFTFFSLSSTKFHHYIFPVIPFGAAIVALYLDKLLRKPTNPFTRVEIVIALLLFILISKDLVTNYRHLINLFVYYYERTLPREIMHSVRMMMYGFFIPMGFAIGLPMIRRKVQSIHVFGLIILAAGFSLACNTWLMPKLSDTFSQKKLYEAYTEVATDNEPICEFHTWQRRSVSYYFNNKSTYIDSRKSKRGKKFFKQKGDFYCMVDKSQYSRLRERVKSASKRELYLINSDHPVTNLVGTKSLKKTNKASNFSDTYLLEKLPPINNHLDATWGDAIQLIGWETDKTTYQIGKPIEITLYFRALKDIKTDYQVFIHGDVGNNGGRLTGDHTPATGRYPTDRWKKGQLIKDVWKGRIPTRLARGSMNLNIGFFTESARLPISSGPKDRDGRLFLGQVHLKN